MMRPARFSHRLWLPLVLVLALAGAAVAGMAARAGMTAKRAVVVKVTEKEYSLAFSVKTFKPASYVFMAMDKGRLAHSLEINGPGVRNKRIPGTIAPGRSKSLKVVLRKGNYRIWCPVPGHAGLGMKATIKVGTSSGSGPTTSSGTTTKSAWA